MEKPSQIVEYMYPAKLVRILDGDTIEIVIDGGFNHRFKDRVRLLGIDTYELRDKDPDKREKAKLAKAFLEGVFEEYTAKHGSWFALYCIKYDHSGKYGRLLGTLLLPYPSGEVVDIRDLLVENDCVEHKDEYESMHALPRTDEQ